MLYFKKFISYIDCFESGNKIGNAGYVKVIIEDKKCTLDIHIKGWRRADNLCIPIKTLQDTFLGEIQLLHGAGDYHASYCADNVDGHGTPIELIHGLHFPFTDDCYCHTVWEEENNSRKIPKTEEKKVEEKKRLAEEKESEEKKEFQTDNAFDKERIVIRNKDSDADTTVKETVSIHKPDSIKAAEQKQQDHREIPQYSADRDSLYTDKWQQLCHTYQQIHPFEDGDEFISIEPRDFVIMRQEYQKLVNNSFLLHGFYNYRHIILGRKQGNPQYYIGVPGTYYEREKMVAVMFGFEAFEPSGEQQVKKQIEQGTYGYYMRKVDI